MGPAGFPPSLSGVRVAVDPPDSAQARDDERALTAAGATVVRTLDARTGPRSSASPLVVVLRAGSVVELERRQASVREQADPETLSVVVGACLGSSDRARLLRGGADDCLSGHYLPDELVARIAALVRRQPGSRKDLVVSGGLTIDVERRSVRLDGRAVLLTPREFHLLTYLLRHPDTGLSREQLLAHVWGYRFGSTETVTVHVRRLRAKIESDPAHPERILTLRGVGYVWASPGPAAAGPEFPVL